MLDASSGGNLHLVDYADDSWWGDDSWGSDWSWYDANVAWPNSDQYEPPSEPSPPAESMGELQPAELEDENVREALQSEKVAEALAAEARETTAALRRDRGFGQAKGQGKSSGGAKGSGCWICGSNSHFAANCPDKLQIAIEVRRVVGE